jgi:hypothetical protein
VKDGAAKLTVKPKSTGEHDYLASFSPSDDTEFTASSSAVVHVTVTKATTPPRTAKLTISEASVPAGGSLVISGSGFEPDAVVTLTLHSTPVDLGTATANGDGSFVATVTIPSSTARGAHTVEASTKDGTTVSVALTVTAKGTVAAGGSVSASADDLADTGSTGVLGLGLLALLIIALGAAVATVARIRRKRRVA